MIKALIIAFLGEEFYYVTFCGMTYEEYCSHKQARIAELKAQEIDWKNAEQKRLEQLEKDFKDPSKFAVINLEHESTTSLQSAKEVMDEVQKGEIWKYAHVMYSRQMGCVSFKVDTYFISSQIRGVTYKLKLLCHPQNKAVIQHTKNLLELL